jgi:ABC-2 type transport system permease protein
MFWRNPSAAFFNFVLPLLFLALFGAIFAGTQDDLDVDRAPASPGWRS